MSSTPSLVSLGLANPLIVDPSQSPTLDGAVPTQTQPKMTPKNTTNAFSESLVVTTGLDATPWYKDVSTGKLFTGNSQIREYLSPVQFEVLLPYGADPLADSTGAPVRVVLNASLSQFEPSSGQVVVREPSRSGFHVTFWGAQPDLISGSGSTGAFLNRMGLTTIMSLGRMPDNRKQQILDSFGGNKVPSDALRVAAQDAFAELLMLFRMNGVWWFRGSTTTPIKDGKPTQALDVDQWVPGAGVSTAQENASTGDVEARGSVAMYFRNDCFLGYFKTLSWEMDASKPYQWQFNFVFQVERSITQLWYPH